MKKVIDKKLYNTETAKEIGSFHFPGNLDGITETLYFTQSGKYFMHGEGGPRSRYGRHSESGGFKGGEDIVPFSLEEARSWAEEHLTADDYLKWFEVEDDEESDGRERFTTNLLRSCKTKLRQIKEATGKTYATIIEEMVEDYDLEGVK